LGHECGVLGGIQAALEDGQKVVEIVAQQGGRNEPQSGEDRTAEDAVFRRSQPFESSLAKDELIDLPIEHAPDDVFANVMTPVNSELVVHIVVDAAGGDFGDEVRGAVVVIIVIDPGLPPALGRDGRQSG
jgi:hypothetical protein